MDGHRFALFNCQGGLFDELPVEDIRDLMLLRFLPAQWIYFCLFWHEHQWGQVQFFAFPVRDIFVSYQQIGSSDNILKFLESQFSQVLPDFFGNEPKVVFHIIRTAIETFPEFFVLRCHSNRTGVQVTFTHHHAPKDDQCCSGKSKLFRSHECCHDHIATIFHLSVGLEHHFFPQVVHHQDLLRFGQPHLQRQTCMFDRRARTGSCTALCSTDRDQVGRCFGHTCSNGSYSRFGDKLHTYLRIRIHVFQIKDQLCKVFNRIDIVVGRGRDQRNPWYRVPGPGDDLVHLVSRQLSALPGFCALGDLDLYFVCIYQVFRGNPKSPAGYLFDLTSCTVTIFKRFEPGRVLTPFAGIASSANPIHGNGQRFMGFFADGAI